MPQTQQQPAADPYALKCLEVWGGSSNANHAASVTGLDISVSSRPVEGSESGGDLYLISSCSSGWISRILLADVSGHGNAVSDLSSQLRKAMHKSINTVDQSKLARSLNKSFDQISDGSKFATALLMTYFAPSGHLILVNAGHPPPLLRRADSDEWHPINQSMPGVLRETSNQVKVGIKNLPLGVISSTQYEQIAIKLNKGDRICAYTDAFTEAQHDNGTLLGTHGLAETLNRSHSHEDSDHAVSVLSDIQTRGFNTADDDHTMLMLHHNGQSPSPVGIETVSNYIKNSFGFGHTDTELTHEHAS
jgi:phosphoserine phosphatase RsbU/P